MSGSTTRTSRQDSGPLRVMLGFAAVWGASILAFALANDGIWMYRKLLFLAVIALCTLSGLLLAANPHHDAVARQAPIQELRGWCVAGLDTGCSGVLLVLVAGYLCIGLDSRDRRWGNHLPYRGAWVETPIRRGAGRNAAPMSATGFIRRAVRHGLRTPTRHLRRIDHPIRRQPFPSSHVCGAATSQAWAASAQRPNGGGSLPFHPSNHNRGEVCPSRLFPSWRRRACGVAYRRRLRRPPRSTCPSPAPRRRCRADPTSETPAAIRGACASRCRRCR